MGTMLEILPPLAVAFQRRVDGDDAQPANHFGRIGDFALADGEMFREIVHIVVYTVQGFIGDSHSRSRGIADAAFEHIVDSGILYHFAIDVEARNLLAGTQGFEHGVSGGSHSTLYGQKLWWNAPGLHIVEQQIGHMLSDEHNLAIGFAECASLFGNVAFDDTYYFLRVNAHEVVADAVVRRMDVHHFATSRGSQVSCR